MSLITANSLTKSFGAEDLFANVSFSVAKGARLALVGPNGIGKTTLLRILIGEEEPSSGSVVHAKSLRMGYLPQEADFELTGTLWDVCLEPFADLLRMQSELETLEVEMSDPSKRDSALARYGTLQHAFEQRGGYVYEVQIKQVLTGLGFDPIDFQMSLDHLSGGQRTRGMARRSSFHTIVTSSTMPAMPCSRWRLAGQNIIAATTQPICRSARTAGGIAWRCSNPSATS
jgi:ATP-binding cassette subfamily F protein 3